MKLNNKNISIEVNEFGEIASIKFKEKEVLHDGKQWWEKTYPMIWPVVGISKGFVVDGKNYKIPKHGFWNKLDWEIMYEQDSITVVATHLASDIYPFSIDIQNNVHLDGDTINIKTVFSNIGKEDAYFHFGHHPAFKIDDSSHIHTSDGNPQKITIDGRLRKETVTQTLLKKMGFGIDYDTLVYKEFSGNLWLTNKEYKVNFKSKDFESMQVWKPKNAGFVCIEPWNGYNDPEYDAPLEASEKIDIIKLGKGEVKTFKFDFTFYQNIIK